MATGGEGHSCESYSEHSLHDTKVTAGRTLNEHQGFGGGGRHFCLGAGLARLEMKIWLEETLRRFPEIKLDGEPTRLSSTFLNQYRTIPVAV